MGQAARRRAEYDLEELGRGLRTFRRVLVGAGIVGLALAALLFVRQRDLLQPGYLLLVAGVVLVFVAAVRLMREPVLWTRMVAVVQGAGFLFTERGDEGYWMLVYYRLFVLGFVAVAAEAQLIFARYPDLKISRHWLGNVPLPHDGRVRSRYLDRVREGRRTVVAWATGVLVIVAAGLGVWLWTLRQAYQPPPLEPHAREVLRLWNADDHRGLAALLGAGGAAKLRGGLADRGWSELPRLEEAGTYYDRHKGVAHYSLASDPEAAGVDAYFERRGDRWALTGISMVDIEGLLREFRGLR